MYGRTDGAAVPTAAENNSAAERGRMAEYGGI